MKISFVRDVDCVDFSKPFAFYRYDEAVAGHKNYVDIKAIVSNKAYSWLDDIHSSHTDLSKNIEKYSKWWWVIPASRLDARPWGQEYVLKPFIFARALAEWVETAQGVEEISIVGCDKNVAVYLKEFQKGLIFENRNCPNVFMHTFKNIALAFCKVFDQAVFLFKNNIFKRPDNVNSNVFVVFELVKGTKLIDGHNYYFGSIFELLKVEGKTIAYAGIIGKGCNNKKTYSQTESVSSIFSHSCPPPTL